MSESGETILKLASDGYYNDELEPGEYDKILISENDAMSYEFKLVPTDDGTMRLREVDADV